MRGKFEEQLERLNSSLIEMGLFIEHAIDMAVKALVEQDAELAQEAIEYDSKIDQKEKEIENLCLQILLQQQPVAKDLRAVSSALKMITDMERIGDHAEDISEFTILLADADYIKEMIHIPQMADATIKMVKNAIDAFVNKDMKMAADVILYDDVVDGLFLEVRDDLLGLIRQNVNNCQQAFDLIMIAKYLERIGDHAANIAEWVMFYITGKHEKVKKESKKKGLDKLADPTRKI
jgi:phosphate transport system protein